MLQLTVKAICIWCLILVAAMINGLLREAVLIPLLGQTPALIFSGIFLSLLIIAISYFCLPWLSVSTPKILFVIGSGWLFLTLIFEFSLGFLQGKSLALLLEAYTFKNGNIWPVVLLITVCAPYLAAKLRKYL